MFERKLTFVVIPDSQGATRQVTIPRTTAYIAAFAVVFLLLSTVYLAADLFTVKVAQSELKSLRAENRELAAKFEEVRWSLNEVEGRYQNLVQKEIAVRGLFGLEEIAPEERQLGIGGPVSPAVAVMSTSERSAYDTEREIDRLLRLSEFEIQSYDEIENELTNLQDRLLHTPSIWPTKGWVSCGYGMRDDPFTGYRRMHHGLDIANNRGTSIVATADGKVTKVYYSNSHGRIVVVDHGYGFVTRYAHLHKAKVKVGQKVKRGDQIALMGSSGYSTGPHLHYEVLRNGKTLNPRKFILNEM